jgi:hypothetical protein
VNGVSLRDIFDRMLVDKPNRPPTFEELTLDRFTDVSARGRNNRKFSEPERMAIAKKEIIAEILDGFENEKAARAFLETMDDYKELADGTQVDDVAVYDALKEIANDPNLNPWNRIKAPEARGNDTISYGVRNAEQVYDLHLKVVDLDDLIAVITSGETTWYPTQTSHRKYRTDHHGEHGRDKQPNAANSGYCTHSEPDMMLFDNRMSEKGSPIVALIT